MKFNVFPIFFSFSVRFDNVKHEIGITFFCVEKSDRNEVNESKKI